MHQTPMDNEMLVPVSNVPVSSENIGFHQPPATQYLPEMMRSYMASAEELRCNEREQVGSTSCRVDWCWHS